MYSVTSKGATIQLQCGGGGYFEITISGLNSHEINNYLSDMREINN